MDTEIILPDDDQSYWPSVGMAALVFGIVYFIISLIGGYITINSEPSGSLLGGGQMIFSSLACLFSGFGGLLAVWHHVNETGAVLKMGRGALIGFMTGVGVAVVMSVLGLLWEVVDPSYTDRLMESMIANYEAMDQIPEEQKQQIIDSMYAEFQSAKTVTGVLKSTLFTAIPVSILNLISGIIGVKLFVDSE